MGALVAVHVHGDGTPTGGAATQPEPPPEAGDPGPEPFSRQGLAPPGVRLEREPLGTMEGAGLPSDGDRQPPGVVVVWAVFCPGR